MWLSSCWEAILRWEEIIASLCCVLGGSHVGLLHKQHAIIGGDMILPVRVVDML